MSTKSVEDDTLGTDEVEFQQWAKQLDVKPEALREAVDAVGTDPNEVQAELNRRSRVETN